MADAKEEKTSSKESVGTVKRREVPPPPPFIAATFPPSNKAHKIIKGNMSTSTSGGPDGDIEDADRDGRRKAKRDARKLMKEIGGIGWFQVNN